MLEMLGIVGATEEKQNACNEEASDEEIAALVEDEIEKALRFAEDEAQQCGDIGETPCGPDGE